MPVLIRILAATGLLFSFFLSWANWQGVLIKGYDLPAGTFFHISGTKFGLENPFPQFGFTFYVFWLIPAGAISTLVLTALNKKLGLVPFITGALSLSLVTVFFLFTKTLITLGVGQQIFSMMRPMAWVHAVSAVALIVCTPLSSYALLKKSLWIVAGPVFVFISFLMIEKYMMNITYDNTGDIKAEYNKSAAELILEFTQNDSLANAQYREKIITVSGRANEVEALGDSTCNIKFSDSTGSYIIFTLDKEHYTQASLIKPGDSVSLKGSCSGSVYSEILSTTSISFKRAVLNKKQ